MSDIKFELISTLMKSAMYDNIGEKCELLKSGTIGFKDGYRYMNLVELSGISSVAILQMKAARIDWESVTSNEVGDYIEYVKGANQ